MKKLTFTAAVAIASAAFAGMPALQPADMIDDNGSGIYNVTLTTKYLSHNVKEVKKTFTTKKNGKDAYDQLVEYYNDNDLGNLAGFKVLDLNGYTYWDVPAEELKVAKITFKYSYYEFKVDKTTGATNMVTKVLSSSNKGVYDATTGKVYLWDTASNAKVSVTNGQQFAIVGSKTKGNVEQQQSGYRAYEVPLMLHGQVIATDDNKTAGGFTGFPEAVKAQDGTTLDFAGLTAYGTGTFDSRKGYVKNVTGNVAGKYPTNLVYGCYGTWKIEKDTKDYGNSSIEAILLQKKCVELVNEANQ